MSVDIGIENNAEYCKRHALVKHERVECYCTQRDMGIEPEPKCGNCKGSGEYVMAKYPFTMNLANGNFRTLWSALGLELSEYGSIDGRELRDALVRAGVELVQRCGSHEIGAQGARLFSFGITPEQAQRYFDLLAQLCDEAEKREERIFWCG